MLFSFMAILCLSSLAIGSDIFYNPTDDGIDAEQSLLLLPSTFASVPSSTLIARNNYGSTEDIESGSQTEMPLIHDDQLNLETDDIDILKFFSDDPLPYRFFLGIVRGFLLVWFMFELSGCLLFIMLYFKNIISHLSS